MLCADVLMEFIDVLIVCADALMVCIDVVYHWCVFLFHLLELLGFLTFFIAGSLAL